MMAYVEILQEEHLENEDLKRETISKQELKKETLNDTRKLEINNYNKDKVSNNVSSLSQVSQVEDFLTHDE